MTFNEALTAYAQPMHTWHALSAADRRAAWIAGIEGGEADIPSDPGGHTFYGLSAATHGDGVRDDGSRYWTRAPTWGEAMEVYRLTYWEAHRLDEMPLGWGLAFFDAAVHHGAGVKIMQRVLGVDDDGRVGGQTIEAATKAKGHRWRYGLIPVTRSEHVRQLSHYPEWWHVWEPRFALVSALALTLDEGPAPRGLPLRLPWHPQR